MQKTDYSKIAERYDANPLRQKPVDPEVAGLAEVGQLTIVDLSCGTGNYLQAQIAEYGADGIRWIGIDACEEMLDLARVKNPEAEFIRTAAEEVRLFGDTADYVRCEYAFHHYTDKGAAAERIAEMVRPGGLFVMTNICPEHIRSSWVYRYFPSCREIDAPRFMPPEEICALFSRVGFEVELEVKVRYFSLDIPTALIEAENRDMSQLTLISEEEYAGGLERMRADAAAGAVLVCDFAQLELRGVRRT